MKEKIKRYLAAKSAEDAAYKARVAAEEAIVALMPDAVPEEGSKTVDVDGYKVTLTQRISRKLDEKAYALIADAIPSAVNPVAEVKAYKVDDAGCRWLKANEPGLWTVLSGALTEKPQKLGLKVQKVAP